MILQRLSVPTLFALCCALSACSDDTSSQQGSGDDSCAAGERFNPISGRCEVRAGGMNNNLPDGGMNQGGEEMGDLLDMPSSDADMGQSVPDIGFMPQDGCMPGQRIGCVSEAAEFVCNAEGTRYEPNACPAGQRCLGGECTTRLCLPGTQRCASPEATQRCNADGSAFEQAVACGEGEVCSDDSCKSVCELGKYQSSYVGCEYWTLDLDQHPDPTVNPRPNTIPHSVVISNPNNVPVTISFQSQAVGVSVMVPNPVVPPNDTRAFTMPQLDVDGTSLSSNSIRIVSTQPVVAHQFNPLNNVGAFSNDGTLLLPAPMLGDEYYVVNWPTQYLPPIIGNIPSQHSYVAILATEQGDTFVNVTPKARIDAGMNQITNQPINPITPGVTRTFKLNYGQVLNLQAFSATLGPANNDLTGTHIKASRPVAVFAGHEAAVIGEGRMNNSSDQGSGSCCADHIEHQLLPLRSWDTSYIAALSPGRGTKKDHWRIVSGEDNVTLTTNPPQPGANNVRLNKGQFVTFFSDQSFEVSATGKVQIGQFLVSQEQTSRGNGDPAMLITVPTSRFRADYVLLTPTGYTDNYLQFTRKPGVPIRLNGNLVPDARFSPIGSGAWEAGYVEVSPGVQSVESAQPFGVAAFGYGRAVSYAYIGGLDLVGQEVAR